MKHLLVILLTLVCSCTVLLAQVSDVNKNIKKDNNNSTTTKGSSSARSDNNPSGLGAGLIYFISDIFIGSIVNAQKAVLENKERYPERVSLEVFSTFGTELTNSANYFETGIRGNWGVFATDFKYSYLNDFTGNLKSLDWQVIVFRIPIKGFKIDYGLGFISLPDFDQSYFNSTIGFDWMFHTIGLNIRSHYQWSEQTSLGSRYKKNFDFSIDFKMLTYNKLHINPRLLYSYQNYFEETDFSIYSVGVVLKLY